MCLNEVSLMLLECGKTPVVTDIEGVNSDDSASWMDESDDQDGVCSMIKHRGYLSRYVNDALPVDIFDGLVTVYVPRDLYEKYNIRGRGVLEDLKKNNVEVRGSMVDALKACFIDYIDERYDFPYDMRSEKLFRVRFGQVFVPPDGKRLSKDRCVPLIRIGAEFLNDYGYDGLLFAAIESYRRASN